MNIMNYKYYDTIHIIYVCITETCTWYIISTIYVSYYDNFKIWDLIVEVILILDISKNYGVWKWLPREQEFFIEILDNTGTPCKHEEKNLLFTEQTLKFSC